MSLTRTEMHPAHPPSVRMGHRMVFDELHQQVVLAGGFLGFDYNMKSETYTYAGGDWVLAGSLPNTRSYFGMTYDEANDRVVMFGGMGAHWTDYSDTRYWDGSGWPLITNSGPTGRRNARLVYDATLQKVLLYGGWDSDVAVLDDFWGLDGSTWTPITSAHNPGIRRYHDLAYDPHRHRTALLGGMDSDGMQSDHWEYDGTDWSEVYSLVPPATGRSVSAYDERRGVVVLYTGLENDHTWEFDGARWQNIQTNDKPLPRKNQSMVYDADRGVMVLFGGLSDCCGYQNDVWEYDGANWVQIIPTGQVDSPQYRDGMAMSYDPHRHVTVLFGGYCRDPGPPAVRYVENDTWEYDGVTATWTERFPTGDLPLGRYNGTMVYDAQRQKMVLFGGTLGDSIQGSNLRYQLADTWEYNGATNTWTEIAPTTVPPGRANAAMVYDSLRQLTVMVGGSGNGGASLNDTWEYDGLDWRFSAAFDNPDGGLAGGSAAYYPRLRSVVWHLQRPWFYRYVSDWPDEICQGGLDEDGDGQVDCADPDCDGLPCAAGGVCGAGSCQ